MNDLYCKVFIDSDVSRNNLILHIADFLAASIHGRTVISSSCEIDVSNNSDFDREKGIQVSDGFLYYRYYLDVFPVGNVSREDYVRAISQLLYDLWSLNFKVVAACDFEDELPHNREIRS